MFEAIRHDLKLTLRQLLKSPVFFALTILILALGIGSTTAIFSMVNGVLLRPIPFEGGDRLVLLKQQVAGFEGDLGISPPEVVDYRDQSESLAEVVEYHSMWFTLLGGDEPQRVQTGVVSANFFDALGVRPLHGRFFLPEEEADGAPPVLVLSHGYWQQEFGGDKGVVGQTFEMNQKVHTVVGIAPPIPKYPDDNHVFMPISACPFRSSERVKVNRRARMVALFGRLAPDTEIAEARAEVDLVSSRFSHEHPDVYAEGEIETTLVPLAEELLGDARSRLLILFAAVGLVLLITCANLANLSIARMFRREKELAIRSAMGAGRGGLLRLLWTESTVLALIGGALGVVLASGVLHFLVEFAARFTARADEVRIDARVLLFAFGVSVLTGLVIALLSAISLRRDFFGVLREGGQQATARAGVKALRNALLVGEVAVSFVLLIGAGLMVRSFVKLQNVDGGFDPENVLTMQLSLNWSKYGDPASRVAFFSQLTDRVRSLPGVEAAGMSGNIPLDQEVSMNRGMRIEGRPAADGSQPRIEVRVVGEGLLETIGVPILNGRDFNPGDDAEAPFVALINRSMARRHWEDQVPLGQRITLNDGGTWYTIVGVVADVKHNGLDAEVPDEVYVIDRQNSLFQMNLLARSAGDPMQLVRPIRDLVWEMDPQQPVTNIQTLDQVRRGSLASPRLTTVLLGLFAFVAVVIATAGLAGVITYTVNQKKQEIGVRMALGADRWRVLWSVMREGATVTFIGIVVGIAAAVFFSRLLGSLLYAVAPTDLVTFLAVPLFLTAVVGVACWVPARRATRIDPVLALRSD